MKLWNARIAASTMIAVLFAGNIAVAHSIPAGSSMPVRKSRFVTITNSAEALPLRLLIDNFLDSVAFGPHNTFRQYRSCLEIFLSWLGSQLERDVGTVMFYDVTRQAIEAFREHRLAMESPSSVRIRISVVKAFSKHSADRYRIADAAAMVRNLQPPRPQFLGLHPGQSRALVGAIEKASVRDRFVVELLAMTGVRNGDACGLRIEDVSPDWRSINVHDGKSIDPRRIGIPHDLRRSLMAYMSWRGTRNASPELALLVTDPKRMGRRPEDYRISEKTVWRIVNALCLAAGIPKSLAHPHTLRHTYARNALNIYAKNLGNSSRALLAVQKTLGHRSLATTTHYLTEDDDELFDSIAELGWEKT